MNKTRSSKQVTRNVDIYSKRYTDKNILVTNKLITFNKFSEINYENNTKSNNKFKFELKEDIPQEKLDIYNKYIEFVNESTNINEEILLKLDKMILEISKYNTIDGSDIKKMPVITEIDELIKNANLYK